MKTEKLTNSSIQLYVLSITYYVPDPTQSLGNISVNKKCYLDWASLIAQLVKNPPAMQETSVRFLGREDPLENGEATYSSILACRIPWTV